MAPSVCFVCEHADHNRQYVDTFRSFDPPGLTSLTGRKYLCSWCAQEAVDALGTHVPRELYERSQEAHLAAEEALNELGARLNDMETLAEIAGRLAPSPATPKAKAGTGARKAVREHGDAINKLADE